MSIKTLCPIRDIKGWRNYNKCPYTKSLFLRAGVSDILHTSGRKEKFFAALQKNAGREGYLTKDAMKKTLGELKHELDSKSFYKLCAAVLPDEKQRFSSDRSNSAVSAKINEKCPISGEKISGGLSAGFAPATGQRTAGTICPARTVQFGSTKNNDQKKDSEESSFFRAMRATLKNKN